MTRARRRQRPSDRRRGERGLTLIELLLGLALLALLVSFMAGGLFFTRRAFMLNRTADLAAESDAAVETLSQLLASAVPLETDAKAGPSHVVYDGHSDGVSFIGLGTGHSMRGGLHIIKIRVEDGELVADVTPTQGGATGESGRRVVMLTKIRDVQFRFFGGLDRKAPRTWRNDWSKADALPLQISCHLVFEDDRGPTPTLVVTLRQSE